MKDSIFGILLAFMFTAVGLMAWKSREEVQRPINCMDQRLVVASYQVCSANVSCPMTREGILQGMRLQIAWEASCKEKKDEGKEGQGPKKSTRDLQASN